MDIADAKKEAEVIDLGPFVSASAPTLAAGAGRDFYRGGHF